MNIRYRVELSQTERDELKGLLSGGRHAARKLKRAQILLAADADASDEEIARNVGVSGSTVYRTKRRFVLGSLEAALSEEPRPGADRKLSGKEEALLVAKACSSPPEGCTRWTLELLAEEMVRLTEHDDISRETVRRRLAENELKPWRKDMWCIPQVDGEFAARMGDVLDLYAEEPDRKLLRRPEWGPPKLFFDPPRARQRLWGRKTVCCPSKTTRIFSSFSGLGDEGRLPIGLCIRGKPRLGDGGFQLDGGPDRGPRQARLLPVIVFNRSAGGEQLVGQFVRRCNVASGA